MHLCVHNPEYANTPVLDDGWHQKSPAALCGHPAQHGRQPLRCVSLLQGDPQVQQAMLQHQGTCESSQTVAFTVEGPRAACADLCAAVADLQGTQGCTPLVVD